LVIGLLSWLVRNTTDSVTKRAIAVAFFVGDAVGFIVSLIAQFRGAMNALGWSTVVIYLLLALGFASFTFKKSSP
jgi:Na+(H+)/acetate symporter ActP